MPKRVLLVFQGVNQSKYALKSVLDREEFAAKYEKDNSCRVIPKAGASAYYDEIVEIESEQFFDSPALGFFSKFLLIGVPFRLWDKMGDYFKALYDKERMKQLAEWIANRIKTLKLHHGDDVQIDGIAHSLGSLIALSTDVHFDNLYLFGSPLSSKFWTVKSTANNFLRNRFDKRLEQATFNKLAYFWSDKDGVCTKSDKHSPYLKLRFACGFGFGEWEKWEAFETETTHSLDEYLEFTLAGELIKA